MNCLKCIKLTYFDPSYQKHLHEKIAISTNSFLRHIDIEFQ